MSEDPVKYEPPPREWDPVAARDEMYDRIERLEGVSLDRPEPAYADQQIRIEALRAAAAVMSGVEAGKRSGDITINMASRFAAYLENGE